MRTRRQVGEDTITNRPETSPPAVVLTSTSLSEHIGDFMNLLRGGSERDEPDWLGSRSTSGVDMSAKTGPGVAPPRHGGGRAEDQSGPRNSGGPPDDDGDDGRR